MVYIVNYADGPLFERRRKVNTFTARYIARADKVIEFSFSDIEKKYLEKHKDIFSYKRGAGLWLWKPYLINKALDMLQDGDWLFYADAGSFFISNIKSLVRCAESTNTEILLFEQPLLNRQFTKREAFVKMGIEDHGERQLLGGFLLIKKTKSNKEIIREWMSLCEREDLLSPNRFYLNIDEWDDFIEHREDQSILSLLKIKYQLKSFRDPSDYGKFSRQYRGNGDRIFKPGRYPDSNYPTLLLLPRKASPVLYFIKYILKCCLSKLHLYE